MKLLFSLMFVEHQVGVEVSRDMTAPVDILINNSIAIQLLLPPYDDGKVTTQLNHRLRSLPKTFKKTVVLGVSEGGLEQSKLSFWLQQLVVIELEMTLILVETIDNGASYIKHLIKKIQKLNIDDPHDGGLLGHSQLMEAVQCLPGAGQVKGKALLTHFKSINQIASASVEVQ
jgi:ERCC4-type nuclease